VQYLLCVIMPPAAVISAQSRSTLALNIALTLAFWVPGVVHAVRVTNQLNARARDKEVTSAREKVARVQPTRRKTFDVDQSKARWAWDAASNAAEADAAGFDLTERTAG
jgi:uncharacterized membrane protein YqaE (UPF0057 family)